MTINKTVKKNLAIVYFLGACYCSLFLIMDGFNSFHSVYSYLWKQPLLILSLTSIGIGTFVMIYWSGIFHDEQTVTIEIEEIDNSIELFNKEDIKTPPRFQRDDLLIYIAGIETDSYLDASINDQILSAFCKKVDACQAIIYIKNSKGQFEFESSYCLSKPLDKTIITTGEGLTGQVIANHSPIFLEEIPAGYMDVVSGLGTSCPTQLCIIPALDEDEKLTGLIEIAVFKPYTQDEQSAVIAATSALFWKISQIEKH